MSITWACNKFLTKTFFSQNQPFSLRYIWQRRENLNYSEAENPHWHILILKINWENCKLNCQNFYRVPRAGGGGVDLHMPRCKFTHVYLYLSTFTCAVPCLYVYARLTTQVSPKLAKHINGLTLLLLLLLFLELLLNVAQRTRGGSSIDSCEKKTTM